MKQILTTCLLLVAITGFSQRMIDKEVGDFNEIKVFDLIEVNLIKSDENRILIKGERVDEIKFVNTSVHIEVYSNNEIIEEISTSFIGPDIRMKKK
ncbi:MAG: hypothetical protein R3356_01115 [Eudoraea sp.]|nr:hypothetical protein [Eudoraea sp.]